MLYKKTLVDSLDDMEYCLYQARIQKEEEYADFCANLLRQRYSNADAIYENAIIAIVGEVGLMLMRQYHRIECCGEVFGRRLYTL